LYDIVYTFDWRNLLASDETIKKMIHAIIDKRRELGFVDWGQLPIEEVCKRLNQPKDPNDQKAKPCEEPESE
jgi:hypothetical protein